MFNKNNNKGDGEFSNIQFSWIDLRDYLEYKITRNLETHEEYELYLDLCEYGAKGKREHWQTYRKVLKEIRREWGV